jgi:hypothetical protein
MLGASLLRRMDKRASPSFKQNPLLRKLGGLSAKTENTAEIATTMMG